MSDYLDVPPPELCLGCGDDMEFFWPMGTSDRHICPLVEAGLHARTGRRPR